MSMTNVQKNIGTAMQNRALEILELVSTLEAIVQMFTSEDMASLTDQDYQASFDFAHVTSAEMLAARNSLDTIATTIGQYTAGTHATKLSKIIRTVPN